MVDSKWLERLLGDATDLSETGVTQQENVDDSIQIYVQTYIQTYIQIYIQNMQRMVTNKKVQCTMINRN